MKKTTKWYGLWIGSFVLLIGMFVCQTPGVMAQEDFGASGGEPPAEASASGAGDPAPDFGDTPPAEGGDKPAEATMGGDDAPVASNASEEDQAEALSEKFPFKFDKEKDPFRPIIEKKVAALPPPPTRPTSGPGSGKPSAPPPPPPPPPIKISVMGVVGNDSERLAMINFENEIMTVKKDQDVKGKFKVVEILTDKLVVYSNKEQMRRTFPVGPGAGGK